jgi:hypothetical protein
MTTPVITLLGIGEDIENPCPSVNDIAAEATPSIVKSPVTVPVLDGFTITLICNTYIAGVIVSDCPADNDLVCTCIFYLFYA